VVNCAIDTPAAVTEGNEGEGNDDDD